MRNIAIDALYMLGGVVVWYALVSVVLAVLSIIMLVVSST